MARKEELILAKQLRACRVSILPRVRGGGGGHGQEGGTQGLHPTQGKRDRGFGGGSYG
jgi:hypothetical protein